MILQVKKLDQNAIIPTRGSQGAAGYDLYSIEQATIPPRSRKLISTGIAMAIPTGNYGRIAPRSGLAVKNFIDVGAGVIDEDYRGEDQEFQIQTGDRIAQLIIEKITYTEIQVTDQLDQTIRGSDGFGSTGLSFSNKNKENIDSLQIKQTNQN